MKTLFIKVFLSFSLISFGYLFGAEIPQKTTSSQYAIDGIHKKLNLGCKECHSESKEEDYSNAMKETCFKCHESYEKLKERTGHLGHTNNVHASPHFTNIDCDICHKSHKPSQNLCLQCHGQQTMKQLIVK